MRNEYDFSKGVRGKYVGNVIHQLLPPMDRGQWHHPSVRLLAGDRDPVDVIVTKAREIILAAMDSCEISLPVDPFRLAEIRSIPVIPRSDIRDAQTVPGPGGAPVIEYNPNRPRARIRFSLCHELAHTLFPDCTAQVRHRLFHAQASQTSQELEMLCNLAAAEFLLPLGSVQDDMLKWDLSIDTALSLRLKYEASVEAVLLRLLSFSTSQCAVFAAVGEEVKDVSPPRYRLEYVRSTPNWEPALTRGDYLPEGTAAGDCTAIGFTAKAEEEWVPEEGKFKIEMVGASPYPNKILPRVVGLFRPVGAQTSNELPIRLLRGDALKPRGPGEKIVAHVVNDKTPNWGAGFGKAVQSKWPAVQEHFRSVFEHWHGSRLGLTALSRVDEDVCTFQMVCQHGYGPSASTRLRYEALRKCLEQLRAAALERNATVHMPKIGTGQAGGSWGLIYSLITEELSAKGVEVTVYETPAKVETPNKQVGLFDGGTR
jgi:hypothetical protein